MSATTAPPASPLSAEEHLARKKLRRRWRWKKLLLIFLVIVAAGSVMRMAAPAMITRYVNKVIDRNPIYDGKIGRITLSLWKGQYSIYDIRLNKTTGNVPVPLFYAKRIDLAVQWTALLRGKIRGQVEVVEPELNFVDASNGDDSEQQFGGGGPWLEMIRDLFPFDINRCDITNGSGHFRAFNRKPQVDLFIDRLNVQVENLTNVQSSNKQLFSTVSINGMVMGTAPLTLKTQFDPFSYNPSFQMAMKLIGLDCTKLNEFTKSYGDFDFKKGWFDLVVEIDAKEGAFDGYVKPLFRDLQIFSLSQDLPPNKNILDTFWEALVGVGQGALTNRPRNQFATYIPVKGLLISPKPDILAAVGNVLRNCFIRAYLPRVNGSYAPAVNDMKFDAGQDIDPNSVTDPTAPGNIP